jgi:hypothetical protein
MRVDPKRGEFSKVEGCERRIDPEIRAGRLTVWDGHLWFLGTKYV